MKKFKTETIEKKVLDSITCDNCGETFDINETLYDMDDFILKSYRSGYSSVFGDNNLVELDICPKCVKKIFEKQIRITARS